MWQRFAFLCSVYEGEKSNFHLLNCSSLSVVQDGSYRQNRPNLTTLLVQPISAVLARKLVSLPEDTAQKDRCTPLQVPAAGNALQMHNSNYGMFLTDSKSPSYNCAAKRFSWLWGMFCLDTFLEEAVNSLKIMFLKSDRWKLWFKKKLIIVEGIEH